MQCSLYCCTCSSPLTVHSVCTGYVFCGTLVRVCNKCTQPTNNRSITCNGTSMCESLSGRDGCDGMKDGQKGEHGTVRGTTRSSLANGT